jgi:hypothetical protein
MRSWLLLTVVLFSLCSFADLDRWQKWELERNDLHLNPQIYNQLPSAEELKMYQTETVLMVTVPLSSIGIIANGVDIELSDRMEQLLNAAGLLVHDKNLFEWKTYKKQVRFYIHPKAVHLFKNILSLGKVQKVAVKPSTSPRSPFLIDKIIKLSLPQAINGAIRTVYPLQMKRATYISQIFADAGTVDFLPEVLGVYDKTPGNPFGFIVREIPTEFVIGKKTLVPLLSYVAEHPQGSLLSLNAKLLKSTPQKLVQNRILPALIKSFMAAAQLGVAVEAHQQNVLLELDEKGRFTGRIFFRDLDGCRVDFELREKLGFKDERIKADPEFEWIFDIPKLQELNRTILPFRRNAFESLSFEKSNESTFISIQKSKPIAWSGVIEKAWKTYLIGSSIHLLQQQVPQLNLSLIAEKQLRDRWIKNIGVAPMCGNIYK